MSVCVEDYVRMRGECTHATASHHLLRIDARYRLVLSLQIARPPPLPYIRSPISRSHTYVHISQSENIGDSFGGHRVNRVLRGERSEALKSVKGSLFENGGPGYWDDRIWIS